MLIAMAPMNATHSSQPASMPQLNVKPSCRAATSFKLADTQSFAACMQDEAEAKKEVSRKWTSYSSAARARCGAEVRIGGPPSYVELYECLDIDKRLQQDRQAPATDDASRHL
jgi:hypothetical protein